VLDRATGLFFIDSLGVVDLLGYEFEFSVCDLAIEAGLIADVALALVDGDFEDDTVLVAINQYLFDHLEMAAFFAFFPEFLTRAAEINGPARIYSEIEGFFIHVGDHEYLAGLAVLGDGGNEAIAVEFWGEICTFFNNNVRCHINLLG